MLKKQLCLQSYVLIFNGSNDIEPRDVRKKSSVHKVYDIKFDKCEGWEQRNAIRKRIYITVTPQRNSLRNTPQANSTKQS
ncbi:hypothetical protein MTR67_020565 [Solanum verrucosum]|uniref:Uncharacterized protein n=1 Tax=Solanum verrucosum TaxID=315347 RepID=A0AAF0QU61_SOLVR|nr:hypothetical protein MTR67_020565 [Solanum verrucosum]